MVDTLIIPKLARLIILTGQVDYPHWPKRRYRISCMSVFYGKLILIPVTYDENHEIPTQPAHPYSTCNFCPKTTTTPFLSAKFGQVLYPVLLILHKLVASLFKISLGTASKIMILCFAYGKLYLIIYETVHWKTEYRVALKESKTIILCKWFFRCNKIYPWKLYDVSKTLSLVFLLLFTTKLKKFEQSNWKYCWISKMFYKLSKAFMYT